MSRTYQPKGSDALRLGSKGRYGMFAGKTVCCRISAVENAIVAYLKALYKCPVFSERKLTFTFAICYRPSVRRLSVVCNARAPYSGASDFRQYFYGIIYLGYPLTSVENFTEIVPGEPLRQGS